MKKCGKCLDYLEEDCFSLRKGKLQSFCKECQSKYAKEYREHNRQRLRDNLIKWRKSNESDRSLSEKEKEEESFRATVRNYLKRESKPTYCVFDYSPQELRDYLLKTFGRLPDQEYILKYKKPLKDFDLSKVEHQKAAASFKNLEIVKKEKV